MYSDGMIDDTEIENILEDIRKGASDYSIGKKYKHSPNTIKAIREKYGENDDDIDNGKNEKETLTPIESIGAMVERVKSKKRSERIVQQAEKMIDNEDEALERGRQLLETERRQEIIDEYWDKSIQPKFSNYEWYTAETVNNMINPLKNQIDTLKQQINQLNIDHANEIEQLKTNHANKVTQLESAVDTEKKDGDNIVCYVCGQNLSKSHICIPCPNCLYAGWPIQDNMPRPPLLPPPQFFEFPF